MKVCKKCLNDKSESDFWSCSANKSGLQSYCKECVRIAKKERYEIKSTEILLKNKEYNKINPEVKIKSDKKYKEANKEKISENQKIYRENNREQLNAIQREKYKNDISYRLILGLRNRQNKILKGSKSTTTSLGCSGDELRIYIESLFDENMTWDNRWCIGKDIYTHWSIDHIIPLSRLNDEGITESEIDKILHYSNLRPIYHYENLTKGCRILED